MPYSAKKIIDVIEERFGANRQPRAIILTHGHFDYVGAIVELIELWQVHVFAHELELLFLRGEKCYPQLDATVEGGLIAKIFPIFPVEVIRLGERVRPLPDDGTVPYMPGFQWIHTPGHRPGHVSFFRDEDKLLIAGDAFVTVKQEYIYKVFTQEQEISGPPRYLTTDWTAALESVKKLEALHPAIAITGHGLPMMGNVLMENLYELVQNFDRIAVPDYVNM